MQQGIGNAKEVISENIVHGSNDLKGKSNRKLQKARLTNDRTQELREITPDRNRQKSSKAEEVRGYFIGFLQEKGVVIDHSFLIITYTRWGTSHQR